MLDNRRLANTTVRLLPKLEQPGTQGKVLEAALMLFAERGYASASMRDIASVAGVKAASIYAYYPSKQHILGELCRVAQEEHYRHLRSAVLASGGDPRDQIVASVRAHVGFHTTYSMLAVMGNSELHLLSEKAGAAAFELRRQAANMVEDIVGRGIELGVFHVPDRWLAAAAIGSMGLRVAYWFSPDYGPTAEQVADSYAEFALRILGATDASVAP